jgi:acetyl-CoA synthetase
MPMTDFPRSLIDHGQYNIGHICTRKQCDAGKAEATAMRWVGSDMTAVDITFGDLERQSNRFANVLQGLELKPGEILFTFLPRLPEQFYVFLGSLKAQLVTGTLFSNFGDEALLDRLQDSGARALVTKRSLLKKVLRIRARLPELKYIFLVDGGAECGRDGICDYRALTAAARENFLAAPTAAEIPSILHYTSGSTGKPKGVLHVHRSVLLQSRTAREILGLRDGDRFWCTADQGWVTGTSYGIIGPWSLGISQVHFGGGYDPEKWFELLEREGVTVWYTAPTALRMLLREEEALFSRRDLSRLRAIFSVGEPLNPEVIRWGRRVLKREIYDTWFQTETGAIMICNRPGLPVRPGSMGQPVAGIDAAILDPTGAPVAEGTQGNLCLRAGWDSMFTTYLGNPAAYAQKFRAGYYFTGDTACCDAEGYYWFQGRSDDVINTGGHLISPFEIESALLELPEVAESGAIGAPDELLYEKVVVFVSLHAGVVWTPDLELKLRLHLTNRVSSIATPQAVVVCERVPKNKSGKIMRRVLKARYLGQDEGDLSTLED